MKLNAFRYKELLLVNLEAINKDLWPRIIALVDMNSFFASIEQMDCPELYGRPVAVTNGIQGTCIITCSYEARSWGIKTGMRLKEARQLCPDIIQRPSRPKRYAQISTRIMSALKDITPDIEVFSVDEAFLDLTYCKKIIQSPEKTAKKIQDLVCDISGISCSVGISGDKTTAKYAAKQDKPYGITVIPPLDAEHRLKNIPVDELCGIGRGIRNFLNAHGVYNCGDMKNIPISVLGKHFGNPGRRIWLMAQGKDPEKIQTIIAPPKSIGHGKVMPPDTREKKVILMYLQHMSEKVGARLRKHDLRSSAFFIGLKSKHGWIGSKMKLAYSINDGTKIMKLGQKMIQYKWCGEGIHQIQVTALNPENSDQQIDFLEQGEHASIAVKNRVIDLINDKYGNLTIAPSNLIHRSSMPDVIAPAWKPSGHRQTI